MMAMIICRTHEMAHLGMCNGILLITTTEKHFLYNYVQKYSNDQMPGTRCIVTLSQMPRLGISVGGGGGHFTI